jgi:hypothetical protein
MKALSNMWLEVSGTSKERCAVGFTDLGGLLSTSY